MAEQGNILIGHKDTKSVMTKSNAPLGGYAVNPYVGCTHGCRYCYASFMKRFTGHTEEWGTFLDVKEWPEIKNPEKYAGQKVIIGTVTDGYLPQEETYGKTRRILQKKAERMAAEHGCRFVDNETPYERVPQGHPTIVDYFYHEEVRGTENSGKRNR